MTLHDDESQARTHFHRYLHATKRIPAQSPGCMVSESGALKDSTDIIAPSLQALSNNLFHEGRFPTNLKSAIVAVIEVSATVTDPPFQFCIQRVK